MFDSESAREAGKTSSGRLTDEERHRRASDAAKLRWARKREKLAGMSLSTPVDLSDLDESPAETPTQAPAKPVRAAPASAPRRPPPESFGRGGRAMEAAGVQVGFLRAPMGLMLKGSPLKPKT